MAKSTPSPAGAPPPETEIQKERRLLLRDIQQARRAVKADGTLTSGQRVRLLKDLAAAVRQLQPTDTGKPAPGAGRASPVLLAPVKAPPDKWADQAQAEVDGSRATG